MTIPRHGQQIDTTLAASEKIASQFQQQQMAAFFILGLDQSSSRRDDLDWINMSQHKKRHSIAMQFANIIKMPVNYNHLSLPKYERLLFTTVI